MLKVKLHITKEVLEDMKTARGGYTKTALESLGVGYPPGKGWRKKLIKESRMTIYDDKPALLTELATMIMQHRLIHRFNKIEIIGLPYNNDQAALYLLRLLPECLPGERLVRVRMHRSIQYGYKYPYFERVVFAVRKFLTLPDSEKSAIIYCFNELGINWQGQEATKLIPGRKDSAEQLFNKAVKPETGVSVINALKKRLIG